MRKFGRWNNNFKVRVHKITRRFVKKNVRKEEGRKRRRYGIFLT